MRHKKSDQPDKPDEQTALERRVDAMMSVEPLPKAAETSSSSAKPTSPKSAPPAAQFQPTAPPLPPKLMKIVGAKPSIKILSDKPAKTVAPKPKAAADQPDEPETPQPPTPSVPAPPAPDPPDDPLEDSATDAAVDDITAHEADTQLAVDDAIARRRTAEANQQEQQGFLAWLFTSPWTWLIIIGAAGVAYAWYH